MDEPVRADPSVRRSPEFTNLYSNNVRFESSAWDLKLLFGQLDQSTKPTTIEQHTAMSLTWVQAKLMAYYLEVNLAIYEADNGYIRVPASLIPEPFDPQIVADAPHLKQTWEFLVWLHKRFFPEMHIERPVPPTTPPPEVPRE